MELILITRVENALLLKNALYGHNATQKINLYITATHLILSEIEGDKNENWILHTLIDSIELLSYEIRGCPLLIKCKNFQNFILFIYKDGDRSDLYQTLLNLSKPSRIDDLPLLHNIKSIKNFQSQEYDIKEEYSRMGLPNKEWVLTYLNTSYQLCDLYPETLYIPYQSTPQIIVASSKFRGKGRFPVLTFLDVNGVALCRSSQPLSGLNARSYEDETYLRHLGAANPYVRKSFSQNQDKLVSLQNISTKIINITNQTDCVQNMSKTPNNFNVFTNNDSENIIIDKTKPLFIDKNDSHNSHTPQNMDKIKTMSINNSPVPVGYENIMLPSPQSFTSSMMNMTSFGTINNNYTFNNSNGNIAQPNSCLYIVDTRPKINAMANRAKGAGYENPNFYTNVKFSFCAIENIHVMRTSLAKLIIACQSKWDDMGGYLSALQSSSWLKHIRAILLSATLIAKIMREEKVNVLVHCSDGWDRTAQSCSLAQILLDPYYRTLNGFIALIEKDWLAFGHKFADRCGQFSGDKKEISPIFLQFLDGIYQLMCQFPTAFEFNDTFLVDVYEGVHTCQYANFMGNTQAWRRELASSVNEIHGTIAMQNMFGFWHFLLSQNSLENASNQTVAKNIPIHIENNVTHNDIHHTIQNGGYNKKTSDKTNNFMDTLCVKNTNTTLNLLNLSSKYRNVFYNAPPKHILLRQGEYATQDEYNSQNDNKDYNDAKEIAKKNFETEFSTWQLIPNTCPQNIRVWMKMYARFEIKMHPKNDFAELYKAKLERIQLLETKLNSLKLHLESQKPLLNLQENTLSASNGMAKTTTLENDETQKLISPEINNENIVSQNTSKPENISLVNGCNYECVELKNTLNPKNTDSNKPAIFISSSSMLKKVDLENYDPLLHNCI